VFLQHHFCLKYQGSKRLFAKNTYLQNFKCILEPIGRVRHAAEKFENCFTNKNLMSKNKTLNFDVEQVISKNIKDFVNFSSFVFSLRMRWPHVGPIKFL
jgi:hypothetical protein